MSFLLKAQNTWENFAKYKINDYARLRNFDFGPNNESSVSKLSPFITHRILSEYDLIHDIKVSTKSKIQLNLLKKYFGEFTGKGGWKIDLKFGEILFQKTISILIMSYMKVQLMAIQN